MWLSNNPEASARLRAADAAYDAAMAACAGMNLADKIVAIREARAARQDAYNAEHSACGSPLYIDRAP